MAFDIADPRERFAGGADPRRELAIKASQSVGNKAQFATEQTDAGFDPSIPRFLQAHLEPFLAKKQQEGFYNGMIAQYKAGAETNVLDDEDNIVSNIFGPSNFAQGAAFFTAQANVNKLQETWNNDPELMKLDDAALSKKFAEDAEKAQTGNRWIDQAMQGELVKKMGPTIQLITQKRIAWEQNMAADKYVETQVLAGSNFDNFMKQRVTAGGEAGQQHLDVAALTDFLGTFATIPAGMMPDSALKALNKTAVSLIENHNFYAVTELKRRGVLRSLPQEEYDKLNERITVEGRQALVTASGAYTNDLARLHSRLKKAESADWRPTDGDPARITPFEYAQEATRINLALRRDTGVDDDFMDAKAILAGMNSVTDAQAAAAKTAHDRAFTSGERRASDAAKAAAELLKAQNSVLALNTGQLADGHLRGTVDMNAADIAAKAQVNAGNFSGIIANIANDIVLPGTSDMLRGRIHASRGKGWTNDLDKSRIEFDKLNKASPGTAAAYYKDDYPKLARLSSMVTDSGIPPQLAWTALYGDEMIGPDIPINKERAATVPKVITAYLEKNKPNKLLNFEPAWNASANRSITRSLSSFVGSMQGTSMSDEQIVAAGMVKQQANGSLEMYGPFAWEQRSGTTPLYQKIGIPKDTMNGVFTREVDARLKARGFAPGAKGDDYEIVREPGPNGTENILVFAGDGKGGMFHTTFSTTHLKARADEEARNIIGGKLVFVPGTAAEAPKLGGNLRDNMRAQFKAKPAAPSRFVRQDDLK